MKTILKYLFDEGGQFWGNFAQSYAASVERARDRPLKEAMMKANIAHQQAVADKAQMDIETARQHQSALNDLTKILQPTEVSTPTEGPATEAGVGPAPVVTKKMPDFKSPEVQGALVRAQPKEAATQMLKQLGPQAAKFGYDSLEEYNAAALTPEFASAFPYGHRPTIKNGKIVPEGINPVNTVDQQMHRWSVLNKDASPEQVLAQRNKFINEAAAATTAGTENTRNIIRDQGPNAVSIPGIGPVGQPNPGAAAPAGTPAQQPTAASQQPGYNPYLHGKQQAAAATAQGAEQVKAQKGLLALGGLKTLVDRLDALSTTIPAGDPGIDRFSTGAKNWLASKMQTDPNIAEFETKRKAYANILNRSLLAERGVITDRDREYAIEAIPSIWDTKDVRTLKMTQFKAMSDLMVWGEEQLANGKLDPAMFRQKLDAIQNQMNAANPVKKGGAASTPNAPKKKGLTFNVQTGEIE